MMQMPMSDIYIMPCRISLERSSKNEAGWDI